MDTASATEPEAPPIPVYEWSAARCPQCGRLNNRGVLSTQGAVRYRKCNACGKKYKHTGKFAGYL